MPYCTTKADSNVSIYHEQIIGTLTVSVKIASLHEPFATSTWKHKLSMLRLLPTNRCTRNRLRESVVCNLRQTSTEGGQRSMATNLKQEHSNYSCSKLKVFVVWSQTLLGPQY